MAQHTTQKGEKEVNSEVRNRKTLDKSVLAKGRFDKKTREFNGNYSKDTRLRYGKLRPQKA